VSVSFVYCGQTVGWIKMKLGMEIGLGPGHIVLDGDPALLRGVQPPNFRPMSLMVRAEPAAKRILVQSTAQNLQIC